jgi:hypothetical protein
MRRVLRIIAHGPGSIAGIGIVMTIDDPFVCKKCAGHAAYECIGANPGDLIYRCTACDAVHLTRFPMQWISDPLSFKAGRWPDVISAKRSARARRAGLLRIRK